MGGDKRHVTRKERTHRAGVGGEAEESREKVPASPVGEADEVLAKNTLYASNVRVAHVTKFDSRVPKG